LYLSKNLMKNIEVLNHDYETNLNIPRQSF